MPSSSALSVAFLRRIRWEPALAVVVPALLATLIATGAGCSGGGERGMAGSVSADTLQVWMDEARPLLILDVRPQGEFEARHLPGAIGAEGKTVRDLSAVLPMDPSVPLIVVSEDGVVPQGRPDLADEAAETYGFPNVLRLEGGLRAWEARGYTLDGNHVPRDSP